MAVVNNILDVLDTLKHRGFSPTDRAIVFSQWMQYSVHFFGNPNHLHRTTHHHMRERISQRVQELLSNLDSPFELHSKMYRHKIYNILSESDPQRGKAFRENTIKDFETHRMGPGFSAQRYMDAFCCRQPQKWNELRDMNIGEADLQLIIKRHLPQTHQAFQIPSDLTLDHAHALLNAAIERAQIPVCCVDSLTLVSVDACFALAKSIDRVCDAFETLGVKGFGLDGVDLNVVATLYEGSSGFSEPKPRNSSYLPITKPLVCISSHCGLEFDDVIIHEYLHAHDVLFNTTTSDPSSSARNLLSENTNAQEPVAQAWRELNCKLTQLESTHCVEDQKILARKGIGQRWATLGVNPQKLEECVAQWESSTESERDQTFYKNVTKLFRNTDFVNSAGFRTEVILAECKLLGTMDGGAVYRRFMEQFDDFYLNVTQEKYYGRGYFEDVAEKMARSIQLTLDILPSSKLVDNPYAKRWLVYPDQSLAPQISQLWKDFFALECVQEAYAGLRNSNPQLTNLHNQIEKQRQLKNTLRETDFKKAAL